MILILGCKSLDQQNIESEDGHAEDKFYTINLSSIIENKREVPISEIADSITYIRLESTGESALGRIQDIKLTKEYIFIYAFGTPLLAQFDAKGKFLRFIGKVGKGPEEYDMIRQFSIDEEAGLIYIQPNWKRIIQVYSFAGDYVKSIKTNIDERAIIWSRDSILMCYSEPLVGNEEYIFKEINLHGQILQTVKNYNKWKDPPPFGRTRFYQGQQFFYYLDNTLHFKGLYNDTVYTYNQTNRIIPKFSLNLGEYKLPEEMIFERGLVQRTPPKYLWVSVKESKNFVFIYFSAYDTDDSQGAGHGELNAGFAIYNKKEGSGITLKSNYGKLISFNTIGDWGFINDFDGGPELVPEFTNDSLVYRHISSIEMKKYLSSDEFLNSSPKYQNLKRILLKQMSDLKDTDNDILMIAKLK